MTAPPSSTGDFASASREEWIALVGKTLKGGDLGRLTRRTADGVSVEPLYEAAADARPFARRMPADASRPWDVRARVAHPDPAQANAQALADLQGGAASLLLVADPVGARGVASTDADALKRALDGVLLDLAPVALDAAWDGARIAGWLAEACVGLTTAAPAFHLDPLTAFAETGVSPSPLTDELDSAARVAASFVADLPNASLFLASGRVLHEAGGTEAQELGFALASAVAYARALEATGLPAAEALPRIVFGVAVDTEPMLTVAKLRAARRLWGRAAAACGSNTPAVIEARSSRRMLTRLDPWTNMLRLTAAGFGAAVGGADAIVLGTLTDALGEPTDFARRQSRNTQLVLMEEAHLGRVRDPAAGSGLIEHLTDGLARAAWSIFQAIESQGGPARALESGWIASEVRRARVAREADVAHRRAGLIGVSEFPDLGERPVAVEAVQRPPNVGATSAGAQCEALTAVRWSEPFEKIRARVALASAEPALALLGPPAEHGPRATFTRGLLAAGGLSAVELDPAAQAPALVILCGSDERYAAEAETAACSAKDAGAKAVWLAGRPGDTESVLRTAGVDRFIFAGCDALDALEAALTVLGSPQ